MITTASELIVIAVGVLVCVLSAWGISSPGRLVELVRAAMEKDWGIYLAVVVRLLLGLALIVAAAGSRFPLIFEALGWIAIVAAIVLALMGRSRIRELVNWFSRLSPTLIRMWLLSGFAFGGFLIYGVA